MREFHYQVMARRYVAEFNAASCRPSANVSRQEWRNGRRAETERNAADGVLHFIKCKTILIHRMSTTTRHHAVAQRLKALREAQGVTQEQLSQALGFKDRQTLAAIEAGERRIAPDELAAAARALGVTVDYVTDPYRLVGEGRFSFRAKGVEGAVLDEFEQRAGRWIATYRQLERERGSEPKRLALKLDLSKQSSFEEAAASAEELVREWNLGDAPAERLPAGMYQKLGALVVFVDAPPGISGAASLVPGLSTILVNRQEPRGRRSFDLAHELFHVLTWDAMPPERIEPWAVKPTKGNRVEQLAENFAAALLMPAGTLTRLWEERGSADLHDWLNATATGLGVSAVALKWRLRNLEILTKGDMLGVNDDRLVANGDPQNAGERPPLFSREFVVRVHEAVESGHLSLRRAAGLLDLSTQSFEAVLADYGLSLSYEV
jgi:Zn-dependent peptidase ImmA (M78 family)/DNA-binding XRE family transcriptional regulator